MARYFSPRAVATDNLNIPWKTTFVRSGSSRSVGNEKQRGLILFILRQEGSLLLTSDRREVGKEVLGVGLR